MSVTGRGAGAPPRFCVSPSDAREAGLLAGNLLPSRKISRGLTCKRQARPRVTSLLNAWGDDLRWTPDYGRQVDKYYNAPSYW
jgi:hypothetical protein